MVLYSSLLLQRVLRLSFFFRFRLLLLLLSLLLACPSFAFAEKLSSEHFVGAETCSGCHQQQYQDWRGSHHDQAMMHAGPDAVLGDFNDRVFQYNGITTRFFMKGGEYWVNTDGPDGKLTDYQIEYTFGVAPLQQYLVAFDDGRLQALGIAWDSRPVAEGGQRWFHLYPDEKIDYNDVLHWTRYAFNWNSRCADCHSTNLQKNYQQSTDSYQTTWSEINVACESCHGPGADHVRWSATPDTAVTNKGLVRDVATAGRWQRLPGKDTAELVKGHTQLDNHQVEQCASCHSRRGVIEHFSDGVPAGEELLDTHMVSLIESPLYHVDGQILDEVFVYGSFVQSKMHQRGVVCSNCHNPHSLELKAPGNQVCGQCHNPTRFDGPQHHHHASTSAGAECANCHMPETTYMVVDPRRDHRLKIPRPDLSAELGVPNACNQCHVDQTIQWALEQFEKWYPGQSEQPSYAHLMMAGQRGDARALPQLAAFASDPAQSAIMRASALQLLSNYPNQYALNSALVQLEAADPEVRLAALRVMGRTNLQQRMTHLWPLLNDPVKAVRLEATRLLAGVGLSGNMKAALDSKRQALLDTALTEYLDSLTINADSPSGQLQLGALYHALGDTAKTKAAYLHALKIEPDYTPAMMNLADWYRSQGQDEQAMPLLLRAVDLVPDSVEANYAAGLLYIRRGDLAVASQYLKTAAGLAPNVAHYSYVYAVALYESGKREWAITTLKQALRRHPGNVDILSALSGYLNAMGRSDEAKKYADLLPRG